MNKFFDEVKNFLKKVDNFLQGDPQPPENPSAKSLFDIMEEEERNKPKSPRVKGDGAIEIIIMSDNHGAYSSISEIFRYHPNSDYYIHCGDSNMRPENEYMRKSIVVKGNTDYIYNYNDIENLEIETGEKIFITHGHRHQVKFDLDYITNFASMQDNRPDIILYGHSHKMDVQMVNDFLIINPGSTDEPRDENPPSYAKLRITPEAYDIQILRVKDHSVFKEVQFLREPGHHDPDLEPKH